MFEFALPDLGEGVAEGEIIEWHVDVGDAVEEDDVLLELETDKAAVEVPSPVDGTVAERHGEPGDIVETGATIVTIDDEGGDTTEEAESDAEAADAASEGAEPAGETVASDSEAVESAGDGDRVFAPPHVRRLARELDVDVGAVAGSGPSGRVTEDDVRTAADGDGASGAATTADAAADEPKSAVRKVGDADGSGDADGGGDADSSGDADGGGETEGAAAASDADEPAVKSATRRADAEADRDQTLATPATRKVARELGVDVDAVPTDVTRDGEPFVDAAAVRAYAERGADADAEERAAAARAEEVEGGSSASGSEGAAPTGEKAASASEADATDVGTTEDGLPIARREPYRGIRARIGEQMSRSRREVPHATHMDRVEVAELVAARERLEPLAEDRGVDLTYTPFILKCVAAALQEHPVVNTRLDTEAEEIQYLDAYHVGVATDTDRGLLVPVVEDVDDLGLIECAARVTDLVGRARDGSIDRAEMQGGTFTVTNVGAIGGEYADPVINVPQTAVLAVGALKERPIAVDGEVLAAPTLPLSLAIDHRIIDGADAARFTNTLKTYLQDPTRLLLE